MSDIDATDFLAAGARCSNQRRADGRDPYPTPERIALFRRQVMAMLEDMDGSLSVSELRDMLEEWET